MGLKDVNGEELVRVLVKQGYSITRQKGSHIRLTFSQAGQPDKHLTVPAHKPLKYGTLMGIIKDVSEHLGMAKNELITLLKL
jgi:predicted RNA binding protein YcfA (HicA-like mRNA interferase family)